MRSLRTICAQPVFSVGQTMSITNRVLPHVEFTNLSLGKSNSFITTASTRFTTSSSQLIFVNNSLNDVVFPTIPRTNKNNNKGE